MLLKMLPEEITREPTAKMQWVQYYRNVVMRYCIVVKGWPDTIPFVNLSAVSTALPQLQMLLDNWEKDITYWKELSDAEYEELSRERSTQLESGTIVERAHCTWSDKGKKCMRQPMGTDVSQEHNRPSGSQTTPANTGSNNSSLTNGVDSVPTGATSTATSADVQTALSSLNRNISSSGFEGFMAGF
jgi:hypothetical protein